jgi:hypothetical protein
LPVLSKRRYVPVGVLAAPQFAAQTTHLQDTIEPAAFAGTSLSVSLFGPFDELDIFRRDIVRLGPDLACSPGMNLIG